MLDCYVSKNHIMMLIHMLSQSFDISLIWQHV